MLHVASFRAPDLDRVVAAINARGYGLTFGLHSRIDDRVERVTAGLDVGNIYVNRNQIGAIVGSQPFGGEGLSGTGPKAGGPAYLPRLQRRPTAATIAAPSGPLVSADRLAAALAAARVPPDGPAPGPFDLPGPTGESNRLSLHPRGRVLVLGADAEAAAAHAGLAHHAGNAVLAVADGAVAALAGLPVAALDGQIEPAALTALPGLALVAAEGPEDWLRALRVALAARDGPIVPLVTERDPERYVIERHLCIDTTAAGGNASLLAASA